MPLRVRLACSTVCIGKYQGLSETRVTVRSCVRRRYPSGAVYNWQLERGDKTRRITLEMAVDATCGRRIVSLLKISTIETDNGNRQFQCTG
jgi:hypothetical protein